MKNVMQARRTAFAFEQIFVSRSFFFFLFLLRSCSSIIFDSTTRSRHHRLFRIFSLGFRSSRIGLPLNQVNRDGARFSVSEDRGGKIRRRSIIYICNFAIYRDAFAFRAALCNRPRGLASPPVPRRPPTQG